MRKKRKLTAIFFGNTEIREARDRLSFFAGVGQADYLVAGTEEAKALHQQALDAGAFGARKSEGLPLYIVLELCGNDWVPVYAEYVPVQFHPNGAKSALRGEEPEPSKVYQTKSVTSEGVASMSTD